MKEEKSVTAARADANRKNALKSTGPRTPRGKHYSRLNAVKHGLYCKELLVLDTDQPEFEALRRDLEAQYSPTSPTRRIAFENIVACSWRCKLAGRLERHQLAAQLQANEPDQTEGGVKAVVDPHVSGWYGSSRLNVRAGIRALEHATAEFNAQGSFCEETKEFLRVGFGPEFLETLSRWTPMSQNVIALAYQFAQHQRDWGGVCIPEALSHQKLLWILSRDMRW